MFFQRFLNLAVRPSKRSKKSQSQRRYFVAGISWVLRQEAGRREASHPPDNARRSGWGIDVKEWLYVRSQKRQQIVPVRVWRVLTCMQSWREDFLLVSVYAAGVCVSLVFVWGRSEKKAGGVSKNSAIVTSLAARDA